jgi:hypothetical protein
MGRNPTKDSLDLELLNRIKAMENQLRALTTPQKQGADVFESVKFTTVVVGPITLIPNRLAMVKPTALVTKTTLTQVTWLDDIYIDALDDAHLFPAGSSLVPSDALLEKSSYMSVADSDFTTNRLRYKIVIRNLDSISHNYYFKYTTVLPKTVL